MTEHEIVVMENDCVDFELDVLLVRNMVKIQHLLMSMLLLLDF